MSEVSIFALIASALGMLTYTYDKNGNILSKVTSRNNGTTNSYTYGDGSWKDKLTAINGQSILMMPLEIR